MSGRNKGRLVVSRLREVSDLTDLLPATLEDERPRLLLGGVAPASVILLAVVGVLGGAQARFIGIRVAVPGQVTGTHGPNAVAWISTALLLLLVGFAMLPLFIRPIARLALSDPLEQLEAKMSQRYGLHVRTIAPRLVQVVPSDTQELISKRERRLAWSLGAAAGYPVALILSLALLLLVTGEPLAVWILIPVATLGLTYFQFCDALAAASRYAEVMESVIDIHRFELLRALHWSLPADLAEERRTNRYLSAMLESGGGIAEVRYAYSHEETGSQDSSPSASRPDNVPTIESLKNWTGFVSAWIEGPEHQRLEQDDDASVVLQPHQMYTLVLSMDTDRPKSSPTAEITIDQGEIANTVDFDFLLDSRNIALPPGERRVSVQPDGPPVFDRLSVQPPPPGVTDNIVVQVLQRYRLIQVLTLTVRTDLL